MKLNKYEGFTDEYKYKEGVLSLLESLVEEVILLRQLVTPQEMKPPVEPVVEVKKTRKKKEVV